MRGSGILMTAALVMLLICRAAVFAQATTPGMGSASALGTAVPSTSAFQSNIPLGATELTPNGLSSPAPPACPDFTGSNASTSSGSNASATQNPIFDGGGLTGVETSTLDCAAGSSGAPEAAASGRSTSNSVTVGLGSISGSASIALGATELGTPGESQPPSLSVPAASTSPCAGVSGAPIMTTLPGISSPNGC
jgi:hypothetical protein